MWIFVFAATHYIWIQISQLLIIITIIKTVTVCKIIRWLYFKKLFLFFNLFLFFTLIDIINFTSSMMDYSFDIVASFLTQFIFFTWNIIHFFNKFIFIFIVNLLEPTVIRVLVMRAIKSISVLFLNWNLSFCFVKRILNRLTIKKIIVEMASKHLTYFFRDFEFTVERDYKWYSWFLENLSNDITRASVNHS